MYNRLKIISGIEVSQYLTLNQNGLREIINGQLMVLLLSLLMVRALNKVSLAEAAKVISINLKVEIKTSLLTQQKQQELLLLC